MYPPASDAMTSGSMPVWHRDRPLTDRDDATRFLCAAVHLDQDLADRAVREFLVERTRSTAPSPGVDAGIVLGEAMISRTRRAVRDAALGGLALLFLAAAVLSDSLLTLFAWIVLALVLAVFTTARIDGVLVVRRRPARGPLIALGVLILLVIMVLLLPVPKEALNALTASGSSDGSSFCTGGCSTGPFGGSGTAAWQWVLWLTSVVMLGVLVTDELVVRRLVTHWFRPGVVPGNTNGYPPPGDRPLVQLGSARLRAQLAHYQQRPATAADGECPVIVHRGYAPFVGAGQEIRSWAWAIPLDHRAGAETKDKTEYKTEDKAEPLTSARLYHEVREALSALRKATPLSPSRRLAGLRIFDQVIVPADELVDRYRARDPEAVQFLPSLAEPPVSAISASAADALAVDAREWARYYQCFQVETWDRDLVLTVYVHFAMDEETLYIEWTPCVLWPVNPAYQRIDAWPPSWLVPAARAIVELVTLPSTIAGRVWRVCRPMRPLPFGGHTVNPARYGAAFSLRELAADEQAHNYFQLLDLDRYLKIMDTRFVRTVGRVLHEHGYSSELFLQQAEQIINNTVNVMSGNFAGPVFTGTVDNRGGTVRGGTVSGPTPPPSPPATQ